MRIPLVGVKAINGHSFVLYENILEKGAKNKLVRISYCILKRFVTFI